MQAARHHSVHIEKQRPKPSITHYDVIEHRVFTLLSVCETSKHKFFLLSAAIALLALYRVTSIESHGFSALFFYFHRLRIEVIKLFFVVFLSHLRRERCCENSLTFILASWIDERGFIFSRAVSVSWKLLWKMYSLTVRGSPKLIKLSDDRLAVTRSLEIRDWYSRKGKHRVGFTNKGASRSENCASHVIFVVSGFTKIFPAADVQKTLKIK